MVKKIFEKNIHTAMIQMVPKLHIPMPSRRDMEIPLDFIPLQAAKHPTRTAPPPRGPLELLLPLSLAQDMANMRVALHLVLEQQGVVLEQMHAAGADPVRPVRGVLAQQVAGQDAVARGVLHVDV